MPPSEINPAVHETCVTCDVTGDNLQIQKGAQVHAGTIHTVQGPCSPNVRLCMHCLGPS